MALVKSFSKFGQVFGSAYFRVGKSSGSVFANGGGCQSITVEVWASEAARDTNQQPIAEYNYQVSGENFDNFFTATILNTLNKNPYSQSYVFLKQYNPTVEVTSFSQYPDLRTAQDA